MEDTCVKAGGGEIDQTRNSQSYLEIKASDLHNDNQEYNVSVLTSGDLNQAKFALSTMGCITNGAGKVGEERLIGD